MSDHDDVMQVARLAAQFMRRRFGGPSDGAQPEKWYEILGLVMDAYHELLFGDMKATGNEERNGER